MQPERAPVRTSSGTPVKTAVSSIQIIASRELRSLFYSPIAWVVLIVFVVQMSMSFVSTVAGGTRMSMAGSGNDLHGFHIRQRL